MFLCHTVETYLSMVCSRLYVGFQIDAAKQFASDGTVLSLKYNPRTSHDVMKECSAHSCHREQEVLFFGKLESEILKIEEKQGDQWAKCS